VSQSTSDLFTPEENTNCYDDVKCYVCMWLNNCSFQQYLLLLTLMHPAVTPWIGIRPWHCVPKPQKR